VCACMWLCLRVCVSLREGVCVFLIMLVGLHVRECV